MSEPPKTDALMASLMGGGGSGEDDLFGGQEIVPASVEAPPEVAQPPSYAPDPAFEAPADLGPPIQVASAPEQAPSAPSPASLLMQSGLLADNGTSGGLFDAIDEQEAKASEEAKAQKKAAEEAKAAQQLQDQMQSIHLGQPNANGGQQQQGYAPQQPQQQPQPNVPQGGGGYNNPQMMQHQQQPHANLNLNTNMVNSQPQGMNSQQPMQQSGMMQSGMMNSQLQQQQQQRNSMMNSQQYAQPGMMNSQQQQQQQQPNMMQSQPGMSPNRPGMIPPQTPPRGIISPQQQQQQQQQPGAVQQGFYRENPPQTPQSQFQSPAQQQQPYYSNATPTPQPQGSWTAGMHNATPNMGHPPQMRLQQQLQQPPPPPVPVYASITVDQPLLLSQKSGVFGFGGGAPHWSYQITTVLQSQPPMTWIVRRRFRHVVALEDRLREDCPGAILPPRPDKHATRALEEATAQQSTEFAVQRAAELTVYLNQLALHPICNQSPTLRFFLSLQDDLGAAWPEVSSNALTRLASVSVGAAVKTAEHASHLRNDEGPDTTEDSAEVLALYAAESARMGAVLQAVPKMEGAVTLLREHAEQTGAVGMEVGRLAKEQASDPSPEVELLASGLLRAGRRSKRLSLELSAALNTFSHQHKLCRYERLAFGDRRAAVARRQKERGNPQHMYQQQQYQQQYGQYNQQMDPMSSDAFAECEEVGRRLQSEVQRITWQRQTEWKSSVKVIASAMKEATTERVAIWQGVLDSFHQTFPEYRQAEPQQNMQQQQQNMQQSQQIPQQQQQQQIPPQPLSVPAQAQQS